MFPNRRLRSVLAILSLAVAPTALAGNGIDVALLPAQRALAAGNYRKAYELYSYHAAKNPLAQFTLGLMHRDGWGRHPDPTQACRWFEKAARRSVPAAQQFFGDCLARGLGGTVDGKAAATWYRKAAENGIAIALCDAGSLHIEGKVVDKDVPQGLALCAEAARAGSPPAMLRLAGYYREGTAVPKDMAAARDWYRQAAEHRVVEAQYRLGILLGEGKGGPADLSGALFWLENAASEGYVPAYLRVAILYANIAPDPATKALAPEHLAKIYLWNSAAKARSTDPAQLAEAARIEGMVLAVMPSDWRPKLDREVATHLARFDKQTPSVRAPAE